MAVVQHKNIPDAQLHEPKGIAATASNNVYVADGAGGGTWKRIGSDALAGLSGDAGVAGKKVVSNGTNGFNLVTDAAYGSMTVTTNTNAFTMVAAADTTLKTTSQYQLFTGTGAPWVAGLSSGVTFSVDRLTVSVPGVYQIDLWASVGGFPTTTAKVAIKHRLNGGAFSDRNPVVKSNAVGDADQLTGFGLITLAANDYIQLYVASTASGGLILTDVNFVMKLVKAL